MPTNLYQIIGKMTFLWKHFA